MLMGNIGALAITVADGPIWVTPRDLSLLLGTVSLAANSQCHFFAFYDCSILLSRECM